MNMLFLIFWNGLLEFVFWFIFVLRYFWICLYEVLFWKCIIFFVYISYKMLEENYLVSEMIWWLIVILLKSFVLNMFFVWFFYDFFGLKWWFVKKYCVCDGWIYVDGRFKCRNIKLFFFKKFFWVKCGCVIIFKLVYERKDFYCLVSGGSRFYDMKEVSGIVMLK